MTAPVIAAQSAAYLKPASASHVIPLPTHSEGDLIFIVAMNDATSDQNTPSGWTRIHYSAVPSGRDTAVYWKVAGASEPDPTITITAAEELAYICQVVEGAGDSPVIEITDNTSGSTANADPPSHTASWGADDNLWITGAFTDRYQLTGTPTDYSNAIGIWEGGTGSDCCIRIASRQYSDTDTQDPTHFTISGGSRSNVTFTLAIKPAPTAQLPADHEAEFTTGTQPANWQYSFCDVADLIYPANWDVMTFDNPAGPWWHTKSTPDYDGRVGARSWHTSSDTDKRIVLSCWEAPQSYTNVWVRIRMYASVAGGDRTGQLSHGAGGTLTTVASGQMVNLNDEFVVDYEIGDISAGHKIVASLNANGSFNSDSTVLDYFEIYQPSSETADPMASIVFDPNERVCV